MVTIEICLFSATSVSYLQVVGTIDYQTSLKFMTSSRNISEVGKTLNIYLVLLELDKGEMDRR